jgi:hypothetical protein
VHGTLPWTQSVHPEEAGVSESPEYALLVLVVDQLLDVSPLCLISPTDSLGPTVLVVLQLVASASIRELGDNSVGTRR